MSAAEQQVEVWQPPATYREAVESVEHLADRLIALIDSSERLILDRSDVEFVARRLQRAARVVHRSLPPEVS